MLPSSASLTVWSSTLIPFTVTLWSSLLQDAAHAKSLDSSKRIHLGKNFKVLNMEMLGLVHRNSVAQGVRSRFMVSGVSEHSMLSSSHVPVVGTSCSTRLSCLLASVKPQSLSHINPCAAVAASQSGVWHRAEQAGRKNMDQERMEICGKGS